MRRSEVKNQRNAIEAGSQSGGASTGAVDIPPAIAAFVKAYTISGKEER